MRLDEAVNQVGGVGVVAQVLGVSQGRVIVAMKGAGPMSAKMAKAWNASWGHLYQAKVSCDKRASKKITIQVQSDIWRQAKILADRTGTTPIRALNELARVGSFGNFAAVLAWLYAAGKVSAADVPTEWRFFGGEQWGAGDTLQPMSKMVGWEEGELGEI